MVSLYTSIRDYILANTQITDIRLYNNQLAHLNTETMIGDNCILIEFQDESVTNYSGDIAVIQMTVSLHVVQKRLDADQKERLLLPYSITPLLNNNDLGNPNFRVALTWTGHGVDYEHDMYVNDVINYQCEYVYDWQAELESIKMQITTTLNDTYTDVIVDDSE